MQNLKLMSLLTILGLTIGNKVSIDNVDVIPNILENTIIRLPDVIVKAPKRETSLECLRKNIFLEAANQSDDGMLAVATVVLNRTASKGYPNTICGVVYQAEYVNNKIVKNRCQFSWYCDGKPDNLRITKYNKSAWKRAEDIARRAIMNNERLESVADATHYHASYVTPKWSMTLERINDVDDHIFYK